MATANSLQSLDIYDIVATAAELKIKLLIIQSFLKGSISFSLTNFTQY